MQPTLPLSCWAQSRMDEIARLSSGKVFPTADELMQERAFINGHRVGGQTAPGGGCVFYRTRDGWVALNLARNADRELLPALFCASPCREPETEFADSNEAQVVARGRMMGLAIAGLNERPVSSGTAVTARGDRCIRQRTPSVLDLSALWAGPLASRLLGLAGSSVTRVVSVGREDPLEQSDPGHFDALNASKRVVRVDLKSNDGLTALEGLIANADIVIEAARPRALVQLGIDAEAIVRSKPGLVWVSITGHGVAQEAANWIAFGDDAAVAGGLSRELQAASGRVGFVGDAIGDPLTGIATAATALQHYHQGTAVRIVMSMSGLVGDAIAHEKNADPERWRNALVRWAKLEGRPFAKVDALVPC